MPRQHQLVTVVDSARGWLVSSTVSMRRMRLAIVSVVSSARLSTSRRSWAMASAWRRSCRQWCHRMASPSSVLPGLAEGPEAFVAVPGQEPDPGRWQVLVDEDGLPVGQLLEHVEGGEVGVVLVARPAAVAVGAGGLAEGLGAGAAEEVRPVLAGSRGRRRRGGGVASWRWTARCGRLRGRRTGARPGRGRGRRA